MLNVAILSIDRKRAEWVLRELYEHDENTVYSYDRARGILKIGDTRYRIIRASEPHLRGVRVDQIILDTALIERFHNFINDMLRMSCVPRNLQIIDDRAILNINIG